MRILFTFFKGYLPMRKIPIILFLLFSVSIFATKYAGEFTDLGVGVRPAGIGGAFTTFSGDLQTIWWNPAGLVGLSERPHIYFMHAMLYDNLYTLDAGAFGKKLGDTQWALGFFRNATEDIPFTDTTRFFDYGIDRIPGTGDEGEGNGIWDPGEQIRPDAVYYHNEGDYLFTVSMGRNFGDKLKLGFSVKHLQSYIGQYSAFGFGSDLGAIYEINKNLSLGATARNITGTHIRWSTGRWEQRWPSVWIGAKYYFPMQSIRGGLSLTTDLENRFENYDGIIDIGSYSMDTYLGAEFRLLKHIYLRTGLDKKDFCAGAGIEFAFMRVDYAFVTSAELSNTHRIGLSMEIPKIEHKPKKKEKLEIKPEPEKPPIREIAKEPEKPALPPAPVGKQLAEIYFPLGEAVFSEEAKTELDSVCAIWKRYPANRIYIEGHTDNIDIKTERFPDNYVLSQARAEAVSKYLAESCGVISAKIIIAHFGPDKPRYDMKTEAGRAKNRRVEVYFWEP